MKIVFVGSPSPGPDPEDGDARFIRGVVAELEERAHEVAVHESPPGPPDFDVDLALDDADLVIVHESSGPQLVARIGAHRAWHNGYRLLFHATRPAAAAAEVGVHLDLSHYDGVLANGEAIRGSYLERSSTARTWTWHRAADTRLLYPLSGGEPDADLIWIGEWGDRERVQELRTFLLRPARAARIHGSIYGADYPRSARMRVALAGLHYRGPAVEDRLPQLLAHHRLTVDVPRGERVAAVPGIPTMRAFEAMACGIPLISAPWDDCEGLFRTEQDYLVARDCAEMREAMEAIRDYPELAAKLRGSGLETIRSRHTCGHRAEELLTIDADLRGEPAVEAVG